MPGYFDFQKGVEHVQAAIEGGLMRLGFNSAGKLVTIAPGGGDPVPVNSGDAALNVVWKSLGPPVPFGDMDSFAPALFDQVMVEVATPESVQIDLPLAAPATAGGFIVIINLNPKSDGGSANGEIVWRPQPSDSVAGFGVGLDVSAGSTSVLCYQLLRSDGNGRWSPFVSPNDEFSAT